MSFAQARGVTFHTQELGAGAPGVVMLHGLFTGSLATWYFTAAPALARSRRVLLFDLRGHGRSERTRFGYDLATMAGDLGELATAFQETTGAEPAPLDLVGHSYGALVALRFALDHPARVRRLALVEAPLPPSRFSDLDAFAARAPAEMAEALPEGMRAALGHTGRRATRLIESLRFLSEESSMLADLRAEPDIPDDALARVSCPVLCVYGDRSSCRPAGDRLARALPNARLELLPGGHYLHLDATAQLTAALVEFLDG